jgi:integrase
VRLEGEKPRNRYVEDWELQEVLALEPGRKAGSVRMIQAYLRLKLLTGLARSDLLRLRAGEHLRDDGIHVTRHKTGKATIYEYSQVAERRHAVKLALAARSALSPFLFCKRDGKGYFDEATGECHGWDSMWQRFVDRVLKETKVKERFTEHDLRAKVGSDAASLERARALLQHADSRTTQRVYRRRPERV